MNNNDETQEARITYDVKRLRVGTRVKLLTASSSTYYTIGTIGTLINDSVFHKNNALTDTKGYYWINVIKHPRGAIVCSAIRVCIGKSLFKVLKY